MEPVPKPHSRKSPPSAAQAPRKRRKRNVVTGAPDDCFTCARLGSQCDRRRPYCSQCLDLGRECAGYKTTLTWGVGVASRGKLRGLSLPVSGSQPATASKPRRAAAKSQSQQSQKSPVPGQPAGVESSDKNSPAPAPAPAQQPVHHVSTEPPLLQPHQGPSPAAEPAENVFPMANNPSAQGWPPSSSPLMTYFPLPATANTGSTVSTTPSVIDHRHPGVSWNHKAISTTTDGRLVISRPTLGDSSMTVVQNPKDRHFAQSQVTEEEQEELKHHRLRHTPQSIADGHSPSFSQLLLARSVGSTPRLRYLISYYSEVIAPMIVAFDGPSNPFRTYVLRWAQESTSLQEAIATLSTSNIRQRRERNTASTERTLQARMASLAHRALTDQSFRAGYGTSLPEGVAKEEQYHRGMAVKALNMELADPVQRLSDSVLATLLILCLFHVCDTGVAQFKTQFAGVTKLLAIRMRSSLRLSEELKWFIRMFTWYDTMAATTNDREMQLRGTCLDISAITDGEWGLENLAGCDAGLFKLIAQLGRLNILSQNQQATTSASPDVVAPSTTVPPSMAFYPPGAPVPVDPYIFPLSTPPQPSEQRRQYLSPAFWFEWFSLRQKLESWRFIPPHNDSDSGCSFGADISSTMPFTTHQPYISPPSSPSSQYAVAPQNMEDVFHISESFRHSALLYSERLAHPDLPSAHPRFQQLVQRSMHYISTVKSDVYLLWPLFITGAECVLESHRNTIKERCKDISKDSGFFNNLSCLELLEKVWAANPPADPDQVSLNPGGALSSSLAAFPSVLSGSWSPEEAETASAPAPSSMAGIKGPGFKWQQVMQAKRAEGEYMVA